LFQGENKGTNHVEPEERVAHQKKSVAEGTRESQKIGVGGEGGERGLRSGRYSGQGEGKERQKRSLEWNKNHSGCKERGVNTSEITKEGGNTAREKLGAKFGAKNGYLMATSTREEGGAVKQGLKKKRGKRNAGTTNIVWN